MAKVRTVFYCTDCGNEYPKWQGQCTACRAWNTIVEAEPVPEEKKSGLRSASRPLGSKGASAVRRLPDIDSREEPRIPTGFTELDRVLGGGAVKGSLVLVGGAPGIGKSTLMLQLCGTVAAGVKVLYVSGEESERQIKMRAERLQVSGESLYLLTETDIADAVEAAEALMPDIVIVDSVQTMRNAELSAAAGSVTQVKDSSMTLLQLAKNTGAAVFLVSHVNKEGAIAGPKVLEHIVDCVLYFEGESQTSYRILRAAKNRFGSTNEIGVFEMGEEGLEEIPNPSERLLSGRVPGAPGTCVVCLIEGTRPVLAEIQALVAPSALAVPRRHATGVDYNRAMMLLAALEKRGGVRISGCDAYLNAVGGLTVEDPGADLAIVLATASCFRDKPIGDDVVAVGEVGLTGELRSVSRMDMRIAEARRMGMKRVILPDSARNSLQKHEGVKLLHAKTVGEALRLLGI